MTWLGTNSGKKIDLLNPDPKQFTLDDIATGLSKVSRFNGQIQQVYSVAQHSMYVAELVKKELKLQALLHDATEAFICDVPTPLKRLLGATYKDVENRLARAIGIAFGVELVDLDPAVREADSIMLMTEHERLQLVPAEWEVDYSNGIRYPRFNPQVIWSDTVKEDFIRAVTEAQR